MAKTNTPKRSGTATEIGNRPTLSFSRVNAILLGAAVVVIVVGFTLLAQGSMTVAPVLLVLGYCVLLPIGIIKK
jgi:hypothetical protein